MSNIFIRTASISGAEQLQTRTRTGVNVTRYTELKYRGNLTYQRQVSSRTCNRTLIGTNDFYRTDVYRAISVENCSWYTLYSETVGSCTSTNPNCVSGAQRTKCTYIGTGWLRENQIASMTNTCQWEYYYQTNQNASYTQSPNCSSCIGSIADNCLKKTSTLTSSENVYSYEFSTWSSYSNHSGAEPAGSTVCNESNYQGVGYQYRDNATCSWQLISSTTNLTSCNATSISCENATTSNPDIDCSSYSVCQFGDWTNWTDAVTCVSASPTCEQSRDQGTLQRQCQVV
jgi:hypothetical protein